MVELELLKGVSSAGMLISLVLLLFCFLKYCQWVRGFLFPCQQPKLEESPEHQHHSLLHHRPYPQTTVLPDRYTVWSTPTSPSTSRSKTKNDATLQHPPSAPRTPFYRSP